MKLPYTAFYFDTSFLISLIYPKDLYHPLAKAFLNSVVGKNVMFYTTIDVISETVTTLRYTLKVGYYLADIFLKEIKPELIIYYPTRIEYEKVERTFIKYASDKKLSFCDLVSYIIVRNRLKNIPCLSFDDDFKTLGLTVIDLFVI